MKTKIESHEQFNIKAYEQLMILPLICIKIELHTISLCINYPTNKLCIFITHCHSFTIILNQANHVVHIKYSFVFRQPRSVVLITGANWCLATGEAVKQESDSVISCSNLPLVTWSMIQQYLSKLSIVRQVTCNWFTDPIFT